MKDTNAAPLAAAVYWVGHSLIESKVKTETGRVDLMTLVGTFARARGLDYSHGDHTLWGASLSALWRGRPHGYDRDATEILPKREEFERTSSSFDTLVLTEANATQAQFIWMGWNSPGYRDWIVPEELLFSRNRAPLSSLLQLKK